MSECGAEVRKPGIRSVKSEQVFGPGPKGGGLVALCTPLRAELKREFSAVIRLFELQNVAPAYQRLQGAYKTGSIKRNKF